MTAGGNVGSPGRCSQQAADRAGASSTRSGSSDGHRSNAYGQRGWKRHPVGGLRRVGDLARQRLRQGPGAVGVRDGADERLRVRVERARPQVARRRDLGDPTEVHDRDDVGDVAHDREVVRDEEETELELASELHEEIRDLRLRGRVERGQRLVEDDHRRASRERAGDRDALPLPTGELVRVAARRACRQADLLQEVRHPRASPRPRGDAEDGEHTTDLVADPTARVERRERVLEHHLKARQLTWSRAPGQWPHLLPLEPDRPGDGCDHADGGTGERRLAASRLADEADDLAASDGEARAGDGTDGSDPAPFVLDDDLVQREGGGPGHPRRGSTGQASDRPFTRTSGGTAIRHSSSA